MPIQTHEQLPFIGVIENSRLRERYLRGYSAGCAQEVETIERVERRRRFRSHSRPDEAFGIDTAQLLRDRGEHVIELDPEFKRSYAILRTNGTELAIGGAQHEQLAAHTVEIAVSADMSVRRKLSATAELPAWTRIALAQR